MPTGLRHRSGAGCVDAGGAREAAGQRLVAMRVEASGATMTSTVVNRSSVSHSSRSVSTRPCEDRRPLLARREVVEHDDPARLDQVGDRVDPHRLRVAGVEEEQRERALVGQRRPVGVAHLDLRVVHEDLGGGAGQLRSPARRSGSGRRRGRRSAATPCRRRCRCRTRRACRRGSRPGWPAAGRSRCGRTTRSPRGGRRRRRGGRCRAARGVRSWRAVFHCGTHVSHPEQVVRNRSQTVLRRRTVSPSCGACSYSSTAAARPDERATSPRSSALRPLDPAADDTSLRGGYAGTHAQPAHSPGLLRRPHVTRDRRRRTARRGESAH